MSDVLVRERAFATATNVRPVGWAAGASRWLLLAGSLAATMAFGLQDPRVLAIATAFLAAGFAVADAAHLRAGRVSPITLFAVGAAVTGIADAVGLAAANSERRYQYFVYAIDEHLWSAGVLAFAGAVIPIIGFRLVAGRREWQPLLDVLPRVSLYLDSRTLLRGGAALGVLTVLLNAFVRLPSLGTLTGIILLIPHLVTFAMARVGARHAIRPLQFAALTVALLETIRAFAFAYLRAEIIMPLGAFVLGTLLGARSLRPLRSPLFIPVYLLAIPFALYFGTLGVIRGGAGGVARLEKVYEYQDFEDQAVERGTARADQTVLSRLTTFNQLTQVIHLVERDGFRNGKTLDYLGYAFIPRFLWPEKPVIAKGAWFALEIGQAYTRGDGSISNSVAMTIPGELFLNFDWPGVVGGCLLYGMLLGVFWTRARFWEEPDNAFGSAFGFFLLWTAFGLGADLQLLVTTTAVYLLFVGTAWFLEAIGRGSARIPRRMAAGQQA